MRGTRRRPGQGGQIIVVFALALVAIIAMSALLFDAADWLVTRRKLPGRGCRVSAGRNLSG